MPSGRVLLCGPPGDRRVEWLGGLLRGHGFEPALLGGAAGGTAPAPISVTTIAAGVELSPAASEARGELLAALDETLPPSAPLLALCNAASADEAASYTVRTERVVGLSIFGPPRDDMLVELAPGLGTESAMARHAA